jgi:hypothetical protein
MPAEHLAHRCRPECLCLGCLTSASEATRLKKARNEGLQVLSPRVTDARLPRLDRAQTCVRSGGDLALCQRGTPAKPKDQPLE